MKSFTLLALLAAFAAASPTYDPHPPACSKDSCGFPGIEVPGHKPICSSEKAQHLTPKGCKAYCKNDRKCESYSLGNGSCRLYKVPAYVLLLLFTRTNR